MNKPTPTTEALVARLRAEPPEHVARYEQTVKGVRTWGHEFGHIISRTECEHLLAAVRQNEEQLFRAREDCRTAGLASADYRVQINSGRIVSENLRKDLAAAERELAELRAQQPGAK